MWRVAVLLAAACGRIGFDATSATDADANAPVGRWLDVATNGTATCGIRSDGSLWCWGRNVHANLGGAPTLTQPITRVTDFDDVASIALGDVHGCALRSDGALWCWGTNTAGAIPGIGANETTAPIAIGSDTWSSIAAGDLHTCGIRTDGSLWCWGLGLTGVLGNGSTADQPDPMPVTTVGVGRWRAIATSYYTTCGIQTDHTLWCWGDNGSGQVGDGTRTQRRAPVQIGAGRSWLAVDVDDGHTCALEDTGELWCWGDNYLGQLGTGTRSATSMPTPARATVVPPLVSIEVGGAQSCGTTSDGAALCWGVGEHGELGRVIPATNTPLTIATAAVLVDARRDVTCYIDGDARLWCTGNNSYGQAGAPPGVRTSPTQSDARSDWTRVFAAGHHGCGLTGTALHCWGINHAGELAFERPEDEQTPQAVAGQFQTVALGGEMLAALGGDGSTWLSGWHPDLSTRIYAPTMFTAAGSTAAVAAGYLHTCRLQSDSAIRCGGSNGYGQLGNGSRTNSAGVTLAGTWRMVAAGWDTTCALSMASALWCWGRNDRGQVGNNSTLDALAPQMVTLPGAVGNVDQIAIGQRFTCARTTGGQLYCWGANERGQLGIGTTTMATTPQRVGTRTDWTRLAAGSSHACALASDRTLWCWGKSDEGQAGLPLAATRSEPAQIGSTLWQDVAAGTDFTCALGLDGTRWCFGFNGKGGLGNGAAWLQQFTMIP